MNKIFSVIVTKSLLSRGLSIINLFIISRLGCTLAMHACQLVIVITSESLGIHSELLRFVVGKVSSFVSKHKVMHWNFDI